MHTLHTFYLLDAGISIAGVYFGLGYSVVALGIAVYLEARVMRKRFKLLDFKTCVKYSFLLNIVSTIFGLPLLFYLGNENTYPHNLPNTLGSMAAIYSMAILNIFAAIQIYQWILIAFVITIVVETCGLIFLLKPRPPIKKALGYSIVANLLSYSVIFLIPIVITILGVIVYLFVKV